MNYKSFDKKTAYNNEKANKAVNFTFLNKNYCIENQTVLAGDSITEICNMELYSKYSEESGLKVYNRGISGDTSNRLLERFEENVLLLKPRNLVIMIGTNDLSQKAEVGYVADNIDKMISLSKKSNPDMNVVLQSVYPVVHTNKKKNEKITQLNSLIKSIADKYGILYLDIHSLLLDDKNGLNPKFTYDGLHPNVFGFDIVVKEIIPCLK
ncbi:MAG: GDSL-type esterase/lipase family protein [Acetobacter sp.]|nr:GDSL-type esterase/lipase family protein [Bacteroides sp.]MCM1341009.1 GDSL-type esterase/lipase family protein [Acetobacter sp.]MCM1432435.1 GDSL-type esterase/lipase family protein [Clostridiales bacterium]